MPFFDKYGPWFGLLTCIASAALVIYAFSIVL